MEARESYKIVFRKPKYLLSENGYTELYYHYKIKQSQEDRNSEKLETKEYKMKVSVSEILEPRIVDFIKQSSGHSDLLMKIFLDKAIDAIKKKYKESSLKEIDSIFLKDSDYPDELNINIDVLPEVNGCEVIL